MVAAGKLARIFWRGSAIAYAAALLASLIFLVLRIHAGAFLNTDIQDMLPSGGLNPIVRAAIVQAGEATGNRIAIVVSAAEPEKAQNAADKLVAALKASTLFIDDREDGERTARYLFANRNQLLCETSPAAFDAGTANRIARESEIALFSPTTPLTGDLLRYDPFLLTQRLGSCLAPALKSAGDGVLVSGRLTQSAYRLDVQERVTALLKIWEQDVAADGVKADRAGAVFHTQQGSVVAKRDMSTIAVISVLGVVCLVLLTLRRAQALGYALMVVGCGAIGSLTATLLVFPTIHVLTLVFGAAFIGVTSDYALYYLATGPSTGWKTSDERRAAVAAPVTFCMITSALGFGCLGLFHVAIFSQMATFACAGLVSAWACAFTLLPLIERPPPERKREALAKHWAALERGLARGRWRPITLGGFGVIFLGLCGYGFTRIEILDDVRGFQTRDADLIRQEDAVRAATGVEMSANFLLSWGPDGAAARRSEASLLSRAPAEAVNGLMAISRYDPTAAARGENAARIQALLITPNIGQRAALLGATLDTFKPFEANTPAQKPTWLNDLEGRGGGQTFVIASVPNAAQPALSQAATGASNAMLVEPVASYTSAFAQFRVDGFWAACAAFLVVAAALLVRYRTPRALAILIAPALGCVGGLAASAALNVPISFFSAMAVFVILGTGVDYSILRWEGGRGGDRLQALGDLPVLITAVSAILSLGMLSFSGAYPVRAFGVVVATGLIIAYTISGGAKLFAAGDKWKTNPT